MRVKVFVFIFLAVLATTVFFGALGGGDLMAQSTNTCVTAQCHSSIGKDAFVHGPVAVGQCATCHIEKEKHKFAPLPAKKSELCFKCHAPNNTMKGAHTPVKQGDCTNCHSPHQSKHRYMLKAEGKDLCFICHDKKLAAKPFVHSPVGFEGCNICHNPHQTEFPKMLSAAGNDVCYTCHSNKADDFKSKKFAHKPVQESCVSCHNPHGGEFKNNFTAEGSQELCYKCHADKKDSIGKAKVKHAGLSSEKKCLACHTPHASDYVKQLVKEPADSCMICHDKPMTTPDGKIADMKDFLAKNKVHHGPIKQKDCSSCHNTHGSDNFRILRKPFPAVFYAPFNEKNYELCFTCHEKSLVLDAKTKTLTQFRNGEQNLHYVHVNKTPKGRTCRSCHDAHATNNPNHIRNEVPFGAWGLPVGFQKNQNGGTCLPGCHQRFDYNRVNAVKNK